MQQLDNSRTIKLAFGLRGNEIVGIEDIDGSERGLKCNCVCLACGQPLQAKLGSGKVRPHFSHHTVGCDIVTAQQTALHMLAKDILEENKQLLLPPIEVESDTLNLSEAIENRILWELPPKVVFEESHSIQCDTVVLEKRISDIVPDVIIEYKGQQLLVEMAVTHFIDGIKEEKIKKLGIPVLEINLSGLQDQVLDRQAVVNVLTKQIDCKRWIFNPRHHEARQWAKKEYARLAEKKREEEALKAEANLKRQDQKRQKRLAASDIVKEKFIPDNYKNELLSKENSILAMQVIKSFSFFKNISELPFFLNIPVTGEIVFDCDRRIWQSAIFDQFIFNRKTDGDAPAVHIKRITAWITKHQKIFKLNWDLMPSVFLMIKGYGRSRSLLYEATKQFLEYLQFLGFISKLEYQEADVLATHTITPPDKAHAMELEKVLKQVDRYAPNINDIVDAAINPQKVYRTQDICGYDFFEFEDEKEYFMRQKKKQEQLEKKRVNQRELGLEEILTKIDLSSNAPARDSFGFRWLVCIECGEIKREDEMASYGGSSGPNTGICTDCSRG